MSSNLKEITIYPESEFGAWSIECLNNDNDGTIDKAIFYGTHAKEQVMRYAETEYKNHTPFDVLSSPPPTSIIFTQV